MSGLNPCDRFMHTFDDADVLYSAVHVVFYPFLISMSPMIQPTHLLGLPAHLRLDQIEITHHLLPLSLAVKTAEAACPLCQQVSHRVHSPYTRTLADLPCELAPFLGQAHLRHYPEQLSTMTTPSP
jgi:hypothetical protein